MPEHPANWSRWGRLARWAWLGGRPACTIAASLLPWALAGWRSALVVTVAVTLARPVTRWYVGVVLAAGVATLVPLAGAFVLARLVLGELVMRILGRPTFVRGMISVRVGGLARVRRARHAFIDQLQLVGPLPADLNAAWSDVQQRLAARHAPMPRSERKDSGFETEESLMAYVLVAWSEADIVVLAEAIRRVAAGLLLGRWHGVSDFVPNEDDLFRLLPLAFVEATSRGVAVVVAATSSGLLIQGPDVGLGPVDAPRGLLTALVAGYVVVLATTRPASWIGVVVVTGIAAFFLGRDAFLAALIGVGLSFVVSYLRRAIEGLMISGPRFPRTARTLTSLDTTFRLHGRWRAGEVAAAAQRPGIAIAILHQLADAASTRDKPMVSGAALARIAVLELQRGRVQQAADAADAGARLVGASPSARRWRRTVALARTGIAQVRLQLGQDALAILPNVGHLPARWPEARMARQVCVDAYAQAGRTDDLLALIAQSHQGLWAARDSATTVDSQVAAAQAILAAGDVDRARAYLVDEVLPQVTALERIIERQLTAEAKARVVVISGRASLLQGQIELRSRSADAAVMAFEQAIVRVRATGALTLVASAHILKGAAQAQLKQWTDAVAAIEKGVDALEAQRRQLTSSDARTQAIVSSEQLYGAAFTALHAAQMQGGSERAGVVAAVLMEALHQSALANALRSANFVLGREAGELIERAQSLTRSEQIDLADPERPPVDESEREKVADAARADLAEVMPRAFAEAYLPREVDLDELRRLCRPAHVLSYYCPQGEHLAYCVWIPPDGAPLIHVAETGDRTSQALFAFLGSSDTTEPLCLRSRVLSPHHAPMWKLLAETLLPPALLDELRHLDPDQFLHLLVIPDGQLARFPWAALLIDETRTLTEVAAVQMVPALELLQPSPMPQRTRKRALLHADPDLMDVATCDALIDDLVSSEPSLRMVPHDGHDEVRAALRHPWWDGAFFATHGYGAGLRQQVRLGDGQLLSLSDSLTTDIRWPPWVFFGSCFVGAVEQRVGGEPLGLPTICLLGGADTVIGGTIEVDDALAGRLSRAVLAALAREVHPAEALRLGQVDLVRSKINGWAAFTCISRLAPGDTSADTSAVAASPANTARTVDTTVVDDSAQRTALDRAADLRRQLVTVRGTTRRLETAEALQRAASELADFGLQDAALEANDSVLAVARDLARDASDLPLEFLAWVLNHRSINMSPLRRHDEALAASTEAVAVTRRLLERSPEEPLADLAGYLRNMAVDLRMLERYEEAVAASGEAVEIQRWLTKRDSTLLPDLAAHLRRHAQDLGQVGRHADAVRVSEEAVDIRRQTADQDPEDGPSRLVLAIETLCSQLDAARRTDEALTARDEAITIQRELARSNPSDHLPALVGFLTGQARDLRARSDHQQSVALLDEAVLILRRLAASDPKHLPQLSHSLVDLACGLGQLDHHEEATAADDEAVTIRRRLADVDPERYRPRLALALNNLAIDMGALGDHDRGLALCEEALAIRRDLAADDPVTHLPDVATSHGTRAVRLEAMGRAYEAAQARGDLVQTYRQLVGMDATRFLPELARASYSLSKACEQAGRHDDGLVALEESVDTYRRLAEDGNAAWRRKLATVLFDRSYLLSTMERHEQSITAIDQALEVYRELAATDTDHLPAIGRLLSNRAIELDALDRKEESIACYEDAIPIFRNLSGQQPSYLPDFAYRMGHLEAALNDLERSDEALVVAEELTHVLTQIVDHDPATDQLDLARSVGWLSNHLQRMGRLDEAIRARRKAIAIRQRLAEADPALLAGLADSLSRLANLFHETGELRYAVEHAEQAAAILRPLSEDDPDTHLNELADVLNNLSRYFTDHGRPADGLAAIQEAVSITRRLIEQDPNELPSLALALTNMSEYLRTHDRLQEALAAAEEAVTIWRGIDDSPEARVGLKTSLHELAATLHALGRADEAATATAETKALQQELEGP